MAQTFNCQITGRPYEVSDDEQAAYFSFELPLPSICPEERFRRLLMFQSGGAFFWRECSVTGEKTVSAYSASVPFPVVSPVAWYDGENDPKKYSKGNDESKPFFRQLFELWKRVPRPALSVRSCSQSQVAHDAHAVSGSFMVMRAHHVDNCLYSVGVRDSAYCCDCLYTSGCEYCIECINCSKCRMLRWAEHCIDCSDSYFLFNCKDCSNCLFCSNLEGKEYHIFNKPVSKDEFKTRVENLNLRARVGLESAKEQFYGFIKDHSVPHIYADKHEGVSGNYIYNSQNVLDSFSCANSSGLLRCRDLHNAKSCLEANGYGDRLSNSAQVVSVGTDAHDLVNCIDCNTNVSHLTYCIGCESSSNLFACVGMKDAEYCILNKQYRKRHYEKLKNKIIERLRTEGAYGSFFPRVFAPHAYNHSAAHKMMPLSKVQAETLRFGWDDSSEVLRPSQIIAVADSKDSMEIRDLPDTVAEVREAELSSNTYLCELSGKLFQIHPDELALHQKLGVSFVSRCFEQRHIERIQRLSPQRVAFIQSADSETYLRTAFPQKWKHPVVSWTEWRKNVEAQSAEPQPVS